MFGLKWQTDSCWNQVNFGSYFQSGCCQWCSLKCRYLPVWKSEGLLMRPSCSQSGWQGGTILKNIFKIRCNLYWLTIHTPAPCPCDPRITEVETPSEIRLHSIFYCVYIDACSSNWTPGAWTHQFFPHSHLQPQPLTFLLVAKFSQNCITTET